VSPVKYEQGFISQKTTFFTVAAVKTSNLTKSSVQRPAPYVEDRIFAHIPPSDRLAPSYPQTLWDMYCNPSPQGVRACVRVCLHAAGLHLHEQLCACIEIYYIWSVRHALS
jgi:hypothetical protein